jgi:hypothetical protein
VKPSIGGRKGLTKLPSYRIFLASKGFKKNPNGTLLVEVSGLAVSGLYNGERSASDPYEGDTVRYWGDAQT